MQHGIIKDNISFLYYRYTKIRLFTCSTERELDYVQQYYGYPEGYVKLLGLCRFDELLRTCTSEKLIAIMPTWRKWLSHPTEGTDYRQLEELFLSSDYYRSWNGLLNNSELLHILEEHDWSLVFYLHREAQKYSKYFQSPNQRIIIGTFPDTDVQMLLKRANILVTDYSSVAMDFALLNKPLFYYQFDYKEFRKRHLEEGYFDYIKDGFGPVLSCGNDLLTAMDHCIVNNLSEESIYKQRRDDFFTLRDRNNCQRTYEAKKSI